MSTAPRAGDHLAFGFRLHGVPTRSLTAADRPDWPALHVQRQIGATVAAPAHLDESSARLSLGAGDWLEVDRDSRAATYRTAAAVDDDTLIHPWLAPAATIMARWLGREAFHAGAMLVRGGAWAVAGANEAGKSTILASLATRGSAVLTDDLLIVDRAGVAYAGPRCLDLRLPHVVPGAAAGRLRPVRGEARRRMDLPAVADAAPLRGWVFLEWGRRVEALRCPADGRLTRLLAQRRWAVRPVDPRVLLDLAALPAWILRRPRNAVHLPAAVDLLLQIADGGGSAGHRRGDRGSASLPARN